MIKPEKRPADGHCPQVALTVAAFLGILASGQTEKALNTGYLPSVGPAPLRFQPLAHPSTHNVALPAPQPAQTGVSPATNASEKATAPAAPIQQPNPGPSTDKPDASGDGPQTGEVVSPQMLLKFFSRPTNGGPSGVAPLDFVPPHPADAPASKAEYSSPPH